MTTTATPQAQQLAEDLVRVLDAIRQLHDPETAIMLARQGVLGPLRQLLADDHYIGHHLSEFVEAHVMKASDEAYNIIGHVMGAFDADAVAEDCDPERLQRQLSRCAEYLAEIDTYADAEGWTAEQTADSRARAQADVDELTGLLEGAVQRIAAAS
jgi:hypothetical protein